MRQIKYRALVTLDAPAKGGPGRQYPSGTHALMVHARRIGQPSCDKYFPASIYPDDEQPLMPGEQRIVTITVAEDDAPAYLAAGQPFTIWGASSGHGVISRRVFTAADLI
jgi:hypothetical protein